MMNQAIMWWAAGIIVLAVGAWLILGTKNDSAMMQEDTMQKEQMTGDTNMQDESMKDASMKDDGAMMDDKKMDGGTMMEASGTVKVQ